MILIVRWTLYLKYKEFLEDWILHKYPHNYTYHFLNRLMLSRMLNCCHLLAKLMLPSGSRSWLPMWMKVRSCRIRPLWEREKKQFYILQPQLEIHVFLLRLWKWVIHFRIIKSSEQSITVHTLRLVESGEKSHKKINKFNNMSLPLCRDLNAAFPSF